MNELDLVLLYALCLLPVVTAVFLVWGVRSRSMRGFQSAIVMDGATCLKADDGGVVIRRRIHLYNLWAIVILGPFAFFLLLMLLRFIFFAGISIFLTSVIIGAALLRVALSLVRSLRQPSIIHFKANSRILEIGRGITGQQILFSGISHIRTTPPTKSIFEGVTRIRIQVTLDNGEVIELGSVSGDANKAHTQAAAITQLVAEVTGAAIREPVESIIR
jgi:hypothetical protein